jgi:hypothetical protein
MSEHIDPKLINPEDLFYGDLPSREEENEEYWEEHYKATYEGAEEDGSWIDYLYLFDKGVWKCLELFSDDRNWKTVDSYF